ncbi:PD-(D/E)XK nuclease family protein [Sphingomonas sanguinis]|uniref:PD-(D/E)XK nuclease family protein n=1 Tax=Sphingomonas sanguinis TaxID=33051 RepID=A0ABU5LM87_9SPHN|nr:PD-(D/E)XK nuclease family protein [Sphingomonas sanguinis]MDZ7281045.1 PD-(D/E)XK nuclease family protein [Sphingomonas sanguinis]
MRAPEFCLLDYLDSRENGISRILANLLDPMGSHGQGARFLEAFINWAGLDGSWVTGAHFASVYTEMPTASGKGRGYIDILVRIGGRALAIENKPDANDQPLQVARYLDDLAHHCRDGHCLVYLSGSGDGPTAASIEPARVSREVEAGNLVLTGYPALIDWLEACMPVSRAPAVSAMLEGLVRHIGKRFMGTDDVKEQSDLIDLVTRDRDALEPALAIVEAGDAIRARLLEGVVASVADAARSRGWHIARSDLGPVRYSAITIRFAAKSSLGFGLAVDTASYGWFYYGLNSVDGVRLPAGLKGAMKGLLGAPKSGTAWPVWKLVGPNDRYFPLATHADRAFWLSAQDGSLAAMVIDFVDAVDKRLRADRLLTAVRSR